MQLLIGYDICQSESGKRSLVLTQVIFTKLKELFCIQQSVIY